MISDKLLSILACPATGEKLLIQDQQLVSNDSHIHYPIIHGLPWLLKNPLHSMVDWSVKLNHFNQVLTNEIGQLDNQVKRTKGLTQDRLQKIAHAKRQFQQTVHNLVSPILSAKVASKPVYDALSDRAPTTQNLLSYEANLYRDWVWGEKENQHSVDLVKSLLADHASNRLLVLAAGSAKLAYDLHHSIKPDITVANDINPLLLFAAQQIIFGDGLSIHEFPAQPKDIHAIAPLHQIPPSPANGEFHLVFSDAAKPGFQQGAFDTLITPWLIDIQAHELSVFMQCLNHYLDVGQVWVNFGSLVFNQKRESFCYTKDEIAELALNAGFELETMLQSECEYLRSPYNAGYRMETVTGWRARKVKTVPMQPNLQVLPDWILDSTKPIPPSQQIKAFAFNHQLYAELASQIDGKKSLQKIARQIARQQSIEEKEALAMVKSFYLKIIQEEQ